MAHKKAAGTAKNLRDSAGRRLGIKKFAGQTVTSGNIICRQRGTKWRAGKGTSLGVDHTIYANQDGIVSFREAKRTRYDGRKYTYTYIEVSNLAPLRTTGNKVNTPATSSQTSSNTTVKNNSEKKVATKKSTATQTDAKKKTSSAKKTSTKTKASATKKATTKKSTAKK